MATQKDKKNEVGRPSKIHAFIEKFEEFNVDEKDSAVDIVKKANKILKNNEQIHVKSFKRWRHSGKLKKIGIDSDKRVQKTRGLTYLSQIQYQKEYYHRVLKHDPQKRIRASFSAMIRHHISKKTNKTFECVDYSLQDLTEHLESLFTDGMNWDNYGYKGWHIDHIKPDSWFNYSSIEDEDFKKCWSLNNLQPLWMSDNCSKQNRYEG